MVGLTSVDEVVHHAVVRSHQMDQAGLAESNSVDLCTHTHTHTQTLKLQINLNKYKKCVCVCVCTLVLTVCVRTLACVRVDVRTLACMYARACVHMCARETEGERWRAREQDNIHNAVKGW